MTPVPYAMTLAEAVDALRRGALRCTRRCFPAPHLVRRTGAGGIVLGKTVTAEFAFAQPAKTRKPGHAAFAPGGSSSGSAALAAGRWCEQRLPFRGPV